MEKYTKNLPSKIKPYPVDWHATTKSASSESLQVVQHHPLPTENHPATTALGVVHRLP